MTTARITTMQDLIYHRHNHLKAGCPMSAIPDVELAEADFNETAMAIWRQLHPGLSKEHAAASDTARQMLDEWQKELDAVLAQGKFRMCGVNVVRRAD
jgi:FAD/FMN-containing dehydrogenase